MQQIIRRILCTYFLLLFAFGNARAQQKSYAEQSAATIMRLWPDVSQAPTIIGFTQPAILQGMQTLWYTTGNGSYYQYLEKSLDQLLAVKDSAWVTQGKALLNLYNVTGKTKYAAAAMSIHNLLQSQRHISPVAWYSAVQIWAPFYAAYSRMFHLDTAFADLAIQLKNADKAFAAASQPLANLTATVTDVLEQFPPEHPQRKELLNLLSNYAARLLAKQDKKTAQWRYPAESLTAVAALCKAVRLGYLPVTYLAAAQKTYAAVLKEDIGTDANGQLQFSDNKQGNSVVNSPESLAAFFLASTEIELALLPKPGNNKSVLLDSYFNNEHRKDTTGITSFHYKWEEMDNNGFAIWGFCWQKAGAQLHTLYQAPTPANLKAHQVYIIVDPDTKAESPNPNYMDETSAQNIYNWVNAGGVLVMMMNDSANTEFDHFNILSEKFGIHFNKDMRNKVNGRQYETAQMDVPAGDPIFTTARSIYQKEICTQRLQPPAKTVFTRNGETIMSVAKVGRGTVLAVDDPWLYNEYTDGRNPAADVDNFKAANDLVNWLLRQVGGE